MQDRIPLYPGRVKMTPVAGQANTFDMVRADDPTQAGTPLNKATLLKDATAALFGLGTGAVPDDVLAELGKYKQYWWRRRNYSYKETLTDISANVDVVTSEARTIKIANSINIDADGNVSLSDPESLVFSNIKYMEESEVEEVTRNFAAKAPCYISNANSNPTDIFYLPSGSTVGPNYYSSPAYTIAWGFESNTGGKILLYASAEIKAQKVSSLYGANPWQYIQSSNRNAYPDSGTQDGYEYEYLGIPFDNAVTAPKIETGSYVGTGTYGASNPNTLTFGFKPKFVWIYAYQIPEYPYWYNVGNHVGAFPFDAIPENTFGNRYPPYDDSGPNNNSHSKRTGNTLTWYNTNSANEQFNGAFTYHYIAIG